MELKEFIRKYEIQDFDGFVEWLKQSGYEYKKSEYYDSPNYWEIADGQNFDEMAVKFTGGEELTDEDRERQLEEKRQAAEKKKEYDAKKAAAISSMLITSGFNFDGYTITKYSGYISGDDAVQVARGTTGWFGVGSVDVGEKLMESLVQIRRNALAELKEAAYALGCNAVIGVDYDYITLDPETANINGGTTYLPYVFGVTANGNAVIIEKDKPQ
jgi:uncharacterized protein YbjQ (UPF0145 family)